MSTRLKQKVKFTGLVLITLLFAGCFGSAALYNQEAYAKAVNLKVDALMLMDKATQPYDSCKITILAFKHEFSVAWEYAKGLPNNTEAIKQYEIVGDPQKNLMFGFLARWESKGPLSTTFINDTKGNISEAFDYIIGLESGKKMVKK